MTSSQYTLRLTAEEQQVIFNEGGEKGRRERDGGSWGGDGEGGGR